MARMCPFRFRLILAIFILSTFSASALTTPGLVQRKATKSTALVSTEVRKEARKLVDAWISTAGATTLDGLANRTIAFAGLVPGLDLTLDGKKISATDALVNSSLTIIKSHSNDDDARAIRNAVYALMEIAQGRVEVAKRN